MASRLFKQFLFSHVPMLTYIEGEFAVGATGSVVASSLKGGGISGVTRLNTGQYNVIFTDNFNHYMGSSFTLASPVSGSAVTGGNFSVGTVYEITSPGTTNWQAVGLPTGVTAVSGMTFKASATGAASGTGTAQILGVSNVNTVEVMGDASKTIACPSPYIMLQCLGATASGNTTQTPTNPASGSILKMNFFFRNSSISGPGEV